MKNCDTATYYAFISYNHRDERVAKWLQRKLEHYRLPAIARKELGEDVKIRPVFRYVSDLGIGVLRDALKMELEASRYLLVICSPHSAKPNVKGEHWVNDEIRHFVSLGRADRIIPVIVDGEVDGGERECLPPALKDSGIVGVDMTKEDRRIVIQKVVAKLLGLKPDILIDRYREERRRIRRRWFLGFLPIMLLGVLGGIFAYDSTRTVCWNYADYVDSWGLPQGIFRLNNEQIAHRHLHYKFEYRGYRRKKSIHADSSGWSPGRLLGMERILVRVVQENSIGYPCKANHTEYAARPEIQEFEYDTRGECDRVDAIRYCAFNGDGRPPRLLKRLKLSSVKGVVNGQIEFKGEDDSVTLYGNASATSTSSLNQNLSMQTRTRIARHEILRDSRGRVKCVRFLSAEGTPLPDGDGIYGFDWDIDAESGRIMSRWYVGRDGKRHSNKIGVAGVVYTYEGRNMKSATYVNMLSTPTVGPHGWAVAIDEFDEWDNNVASHYKNAKGEATATMEGVANVVSTFDGHGNGMSLRCYGVDGSPTLCNDGNFGWNAEYDSCGHKIRLVYVGLDERPITTKYGYAEIRFKYDGRGNCTEASFLGADGLPVFNKDGISVVQIIFDSHGNETGRRFFGTDGKPTLSVDGIAGLDAKFDANGRETSRVSIGLDGCPTTTVYGYAEFRLGYDARGNQTSQHYYDASGRPTLHKDGNAGWEAEYDDCGRKTRLVFFGADGLPILPKSGVSELRWKYDSSGNCIEESYHGVDGRPVLNHEGIYMAQNGYDPRGNITSKRFFGVDGRPTLHKEGNAGWDAEYDEFGRSTRFVAIGIDGLPMTMRNGFAEIQSTYDVHGNQTSLRYRDSSGRPTLSMDGTAGWNAEYDDCGSRTSITAIGVDGRPTMSKMGCAEIRSKYDMRGSCVEESYHGKDGQSVLNSEGVAIIRKEYDNRGNITSLRFFDTSGQPTLDKNAIAGSNNEYDACGRPIRIVEIGLDGKPVMENDGIAECRFKYDARGNCIEMSCFDTEGCPILSSNGFAVARSAFDSHGNIIRRRFFGIDGNLCLCKDGNAGWNAEYDERGNQTCVISIGIDGEPIAIDGSGFACERKEFNGRCQPVSLRRCDVEGRLVADDDGFCGVDWEYDAQGRENARYGILADGKKVRQRPVVMFSIVNPNSVADRNGLTPWKWALIGVNDWRPEFCADDDYIDSFYAAMTAAYGRRSVWRFRRTEDDGGPEYIDIQTEPMQVLGVRFEDKWLAESDVRELIERTDAGGETTADKKPIAPPIGEK